MRGEGCAGGVPHIAATCSSPPSRPCAFKTAHTPCAYMSMYAGTSLRRRCRCGQRGIMVCARQKAFWIVLALRSATARRLRTVLDVAGTSQCGDNFEQRAYRDATLDHGVRCSLGTQLRACVTRPEQLQWSRTTHWDAVALAESDQRSRSTPKPHRAPIRLAVAVPIS